MLSIFKKVEKVGPTLYKIGGDTARVDIDRTDRNRHVWKIYAKDADGIFQCHGDVFEFDELDAAIKAAKKLKVG